MTSAQMFGFDPNTISLLVLTAADGKKLFIRDFRIEWDDSLELPGGLTGKIYHTHYKTADVGLGYNAKGEVSFTLSFRVGNGGWKASNLEYVEPELRASTPWNVVPQEYATKQVEAIPSRVAFDSPAEGYYGDFLPVRVAIFALLP